MVPKRSFVATEASTGTKRSKRCDALQRDTSVSKSRIAVIDLAQIDAAKALAEAFTDTGFAVVTNHDVPCQVLASLRQVSLDFFDMTLDEKRAIDGDQAARGFGKSSYTHMDENLAQLLGDFTRPNDVSEALVITRLWDDDLLQRVPKQPEEFGKSIETFRNELHKLQNRIMKLCESAMRTQPGELEAICDTRAPAIRLAHYPDFQGEPAVGQMRSGAHVDTGCITFVFPDPVNADGLQVLVDDAWVDVPFVENAVVFNVASQFHLLTNGAWKAVQHRVLLRPGRRLSVISGMCRIREDAVIKPLEHFLGDGAKFEPILAKLFDADRFALHRPSYLQEQCEDAALGTSQKLVSLK